jgi:hypothetical protein
MNDVIWAGIIGAGAAIVSSALTGVLSYKIALHSENVKKLRRKLGIAYRDLGAFYQLEKYYTEQIAQNEDKTAEAVKRAYRERLRNDGHASPSRYSAPSHIREMLSEK